MCSFHRQVLFASILLFVVACSGGGDPTAPGDTGPIDRPDPEDIRGRLVRSGDRVSALGGTPLGDTYALGSSGILLRRAAGTATWDAVELPAGTEPRRSYRAMWVSPTGTVHLLASREYDTFDGTAWTSSELGFFASFQAMSGLADDDVLGLDGAEIWHFDGTSWTEVDEVENDSYLRDAHAANGGAVLAGDDGTVIVYDGERWEREEADPEADFTAVWVSGGGETFLGDTDGNLHRLDFRGVTRIDGVSTARINALWGTSPTSVYVGADEVLRFDGVNLTSIEGHVWDDPVREIWSTGGNDILAIDSDEFVHYDGAEWTPALGEKSGATAALYDDGVSTRIVAYETIEHFEDGVWIERHDPDDFVTALFGKSPDDVWGVTANTMLHWDGASWTEVARPGTAFIRDIWGPAADDLHAVGEGGFAMHWDGTVWTELPTPTTEDLLRIAGNDETVFAVSSDVLLRFVDGQWFDQVAPSTIGGYFLVEGLLDGTLLGYDRENTFEFVDGAWAELALDLGEAAGYMTGGALDDLFVYTSDRGMVHFDGETVREIPSCAGGSPYAVRTVAPREVWTLGEILIRYAVD